MKKCKICKGEIGNFKVVTKDKKVVISDICAFCKMKRIRWFK